MSPTDRKPLVHGTLAGYRSYACRCEPCREANRIYQRERRAATSTKPTARKPNPQRLYKLAVEKIRSELEELDDAETALDSLVSRNKLALGEKFTHPGSEIEILVLAANPNDLDQIPTETHVFNVLTGRLYRRQNGGYVLERERIERQIEDLPPAPASQGAAA